MNSLISPIEQQQLQELQKQVVIGQAVTDGGPNDQRADLIRELRKRGISLSKIAKVIGLTKERVRQISVGL